MTDSGWQVLLPEARTHFAQHPIALPAYSECLPPPYVGIKPSGVEDPLAWDAADPEGWLIPEWEERTELRPGLEKLAQRVGNRLSRLANGDDQALPRAFLEGNPYLPTGLARGGAGGSRCLCLPLALSKTQDDKGRVRWTLFGLSHLGPFHGFWKSFSPDAHLDVAPRARLARVLAWAFPGMVDVAADLGAAGIRVLPVSDGDDAGIWPAEEIPAALAATREW